jgi:entry exclusion lipoprotein TrbK
MRVSFPAPSIEKWTSLEVHFFGQRKVKSISALGLLLLVLMGCENKYEVNDTNCAPQNVKNLPNNQKRADFINACLARQTP